MSLHLFLDEYPGPDPDESLRKTLGEGIDVNLVAGKRGETPLHVATRRRRLTAVETPGRWSC